MKIPKDLFIFDNTNNVLKGEQPVKYLFQYMNKVIYNHTDHNWLGPCGTNPFKDHKNECRKITKADYVYYKLLGVLDSYEEKRIPRENVKTQNKRSKKPTKANKSY